MSKKERPNTYEWKEDYDVIPASNITHINVENMSFALNLRRSEAAPPLMSPGKDRIALLERAKKMREQAVSGRNKGDSLPASTIGQLVKDNGCKSNVCKQVVVDIFNTHEDTEALKLRMVDLIESFKEDNLILAQLSKDYDNVSEVQQTLLKTLSKLDVDIDTLQRKAKAQKDEQKLLERQIVEANEKLRRTKLKHSGHPDPTSSQFPDSLAGGALADTKQSQKKNGKPSKVHTGHFGMYDGRNQWSCCLADREDAPGCVANESADSLSVLARIKSVFHNQSKVTPLQAHSYRDSSQHHILRYPMMSTDHLNVSFDAEENDFVQQVTSSAAKVSIELPPRPSRRPQTAHPTGASSSAGRLGSTPNIHSHSTNNFAPSSSFFTSASAHAMDQSMTLDNNKRSKRPQSASPMSQFRSDSPNDHHETAHVQPPRRPVSASATSPHHSSHHGGHHHSGHHSHHHHHSGHHGHHHSGHHGHHHRHHHSHQHSHADLDSPFTKSIYNGSTVIETRPKVLPQNTLLKSFRDNRVGQVRTLPPQDGALPRTNRPMSSPAGFGLYRDQQMQHHHPDLVPETLQASTSILQLTGYSPHSHYWSSAPPSDPKAAGRPATAATASASAPRRQ